MGYSLEQLALRIERNGLIGGRDDQWRVGDAGDVELEARCHMGGQDVVGVVAGHQYELQVGLADKSRELDGDAVTSVSWGPTYDPCAS